MADKIMTPAEFYSKLSREDKKAVANAIDYKPIDFIPTGSWVLNSLIGDGTGAGKPGGLPRGHIVEVFGDESSGKSTLGLSGCFQAQLLGIAPPIYVDFERTFHERYAQNIGIDLSKDKFILMKPDHFQHGARLINDALLMKPPLIVVDSVSAMIPREFIEGEVDEAGRIGLQAQLMSAFLMYITKKIDVSNTCLLFVNQMRTRIKKSKWERGPDEESSGGFALKYYSSVRIKLQKGQVEYLEARSNITGKSEKKPVNINVKAMMVKNKIDRPFLSGPVYIRFGEGFDNYMSIIELGVNAGVIKKTGTFLTFSRGGAEIFKVQGKENLRDLLTKDAQVYQQLRDGLVFKEDEEAKIIAAEDDESTDEMVTMLTNVSKSFKETRKAKKEAEEE